MKKRIAAIPILAAFLLLVLFVVFRTMDGFDTDDTGDVSDGYWDTELVGSTQQHVFYTGEYGYVVDDNAPDSAILVRYSGEEDNLEIPSEIDEYVVAGIGDRVFCYQKFKSVTIPDSIQTIGEEAFWGCEITDSLQLPKNVKIARHAFGHTVLPSVVAIPSGATVKEYAFSHCKEMKQVFIDPDATLENSAFHFCSDLARAVCAAGSRLKDKAFDTCSNMQAVILCGDVQTAEESFSECGDFEVTQGENFEVLKCSAVGDSLSGCEKISPEENR